MKLIRSCSVIVALGVLACATEAVAAHVTIGCPADPPRSGDSFTSAIQVDVGTQPLGAYTLAVTYDPAVVIVTAVAGGMTIEFTSSPIANPADFPSGRTRFLAFNAASLTSPTGKVDIARITFKVVGLPGATTSLGLDVITLADTDGTRLTADTNECSVGAATTGTPTVSPTLTVMSPSATRTPLPTATATPTLQETATTTPTATPTLSPPPSPSASPGETASPTVTATPLRTPAPCGGDCNADGMVTVDELLRGVNIALGNQPISDCLGFDRSGDGTVTVDELIFAVTLALDGCPRTPTPTLTETSTPTATFTPTATPTVTPLVTPTPMVNHTPVLQQLGIYRAYPGHEIRLPIGATDPDGDRLVYAAQGLPSGALLDERSGVLTWTPEPDQVGPVYIPFTCTDAGVPPAVARGLLTFQVAALDGCIAAVCDAASGCQSSLVPIDQACCAQAPSDRVARARVGCPEDRVLFVGRNNGGFGRLQNCDRLRVINFLQSGASVRFHVEALCINATRPVKVHARLETKGRLLFNQEQTVILAEGSDGYAMKVPVVFPVLGPGPFYEFEGAEAHLTVSVTDADGAGVQEQLRLILTFNSTDDVPEGVDVLPPAP